MPNLSHAPSAYKQNVIPRAARTEINVLEASLEVVLVLVLVIIWVSQEWAVVEGVLLEALEEVHHAPLLLRACRRRALHVELDLLLVERLRAVPMFLSELSVNASQECLLEPTSERKQTREQYGMLQRGQV